MATLKVGDEVKALTGFSSDDITIYAAGDLGIVCDISDFEYSLSWDSTGKFTVIPEGKWLRYYRKVGEVGTLLELGDQVRALEGFSSDGITHYAAGDTAHVCDISDLEYSLSWDNTGVDSIIPKCRWLKYYRKVGEAGTLLELGDQVRALKGFSSEGITHYAAGDTAHVCDIHDLEYSLSWDSTGVNSVIPKCRWLKYYRKNGEMATSLRLGAGAEGLPPVFLSCRFDGSELQNRVHELHKALLKQGVEALMVKARAGDDFGAMVVDFLTRIKDEEGFFIACCGTNYAEVTDSKYCTYEELKFASDRKLKIVPLQYCDAFPPKPPGDPKGRKLCDFVFSPAMSRVDCRAKTTEEVANVVVKTLQN